VFICVSFYLCSSVFLFGLIHPFAYLCSSVFS